MKIDCKFLKPALLLGSLICAGVLLAQSLPTVVINGKASDVEVRQVDGHWYIDLESLAMATNGTVTIEPNRIVLNVPAEPAEASSAPSSAAAVAPAPPASPPDALSRGFAGAGIAAVAEMREWRGAIETMITYGLAVSAAWAQGYHDRSEAALMQAEIAANTDGDDDALELLRDEFDIQSSWNDQVLAARQALNGAQTINPNALQDDPTLAKLGSCSTFLDSMLVGGSYADNSACH